MIEEYIKAYWELHSPLSIKVLQKSGERVVYDATSAEGRFVFKLADPSKNLVAVKKDTDILQFLASANYPAPRILRAINEENFVEVDGKFIYAMSFIDGAHPEQTVENYELLGQATATLHSLEGYEVPTNFTTYDEIPKMLARAEKFNMNPAYEKLVRALPDFDKLPRCLIHTDIGAHNSIKQPNGDIVLVDWDDAGIGTRILDIGFPLICDFISSKDLKFDEERARAYYISYSEMIELTDLEKKYLFDAALFYALSYTIFDESGIVDGQWNKVIAALEQKDKLLSVLPN